MGSNISLDTLWNSIPISQHTLASEALSAIPETARQYLIHTIAPDTKLASAVRLKMHGEIKLNKWLPFTAEQVISYSHGMIWQATVWMKGMPILGSDRLVNGMGSLRWKMLGIIPVVTAAGEDITRSAIGRVQAESIWLPSMFVGEGVVWQSNKNQLQVSFTSYDHPTALTFTLDQRDRLQSLKMQRWGNPEGEDFHLADFGGVVEDEGTFAGYTIPTKLRIGWYFGSDRFTEGEFFRVTIDHAVYR